MTYPIASVIYGCPYPNGYAPESRQNRGEQFEAAISDWTGYEDGLYGLEESEDSLWVNHYSASPDGDPAGYFGKVLNCANGYWELEPEWFQASIPDDVRRRVDEEWEKLPDTIKELLGRPKLAIAWSDS